MTAWKETTHTCILNVMILPTLKMDTSRVPELLLGSMFRGFRRILFQGSEPRD